MRTRADAFRRWSLWICIIPGLGVGGVLVVRFLGGFERDSWRFLHGAWPTEYGVTLSGSQPSFEYRTYDFPRRFASVVAEISPELNRAGYRSIRNAPTYATWQHRDGAEVWASVGGGRSKQDENSTSVTCARSVSGEDWRSVVRMQFEWRKDR